MRHELRPAVRSAASFVTLLGCLLVTGCGGAERPTPNVVFLVIDTLRADHLGVYGNPRKGTPQLDAIAAEGVVFERAVSQAPWTQPSMASLFSGVYPGVHKVLDYEQAFNATYEGAPKVAVFDDRFVTLAESLRERGYATAGFVANPFVVAEFGFGQGFDHFDTSFANNTTPGGVVNKAAEAWLRGRDPQKPFFLYLHYMDSHGPYTADGEFLDPLLDEVAELVDEGRLKPLTARERKRLGYLDGLPPGSDPARHVPLTRYREYWAARYEAGVRQADLYVGQLAATLRELGLWSEAYVIVTADHGEALCEHGWWDHGLSVHHTDLHVPLILRWPGELPAARRVPQTARLVDVMPTLLEQLGLPVPPGVQGASLLPYLEGAPVREPRIGFAEGLKDGPEEKAVYVGDWKLLRTVPTGRTRLFHMAGDAQEKNDRTAAEPERVAALQAVLDGQLASNERAAAGFQAAHTELTPEQKKRLESLGYLQ